MGDLKVLIKIIMVLCTLKCLIWTPSKMDTEMVKDTVINAFLTFDWTDDKVLLGHSIEPEDSGVGWEFWMADIDFDDNPEMMVSFAANHCGQNSLYVYKYRDGNVVSYIDMVATPESMVVTGIDYKKASSYMDIELVDAYTDRENRYKYLSIDSSIVAGVHSIILYETEFTDPYAQTELAKLVYDDNLKQEEVYFLGDEIASCEELHEKIAKYMEGYEKEEVVYTHLEKTFAREIVGMSAEDKKKELEELYESLRKETRGNDYKIHTNTVLGAQDAGAAYRSLWETGFISGKYAALSGLERVPQCLWGTWEMAAQWYGDGWVECCDYI